MLRRALPKLAEYMKEVPESLKRPLYSGHGMFSVQSFRNRRFLLFTRTPDPMLFEWSVRRSLRSLFYDVPSYNYVWINALGFGFALGMCLRHLYFNPDMYFRRQELAKPLPDRHRQFFYCAGYYNGKSRNLATAYKATFIDNEPDYADYHPLGIRPNRQQIHKRLPGLNQNIPMYYEEDPNYTSALHSNMKRIYQSIGYSKM